MNNAFAAQRVLHKYLNIAFVTAALFGILGLASAASAQNYRAAVLVVGNDRGGVVGTRANEIRRLKRAGKRVEIRGNICLSSCTMYLGAGNVCVDPNTKFGFHGPSNHGRPLQRQHFQYWSEIIAAHYPTAIRRWFMQTARHRKNGYFTISGAELIRHGIERCGDAPA